MVLMPVMFPVPISETMVETLPATVVTSDQLMVSVLAFTASVIAPREVDAVRVLALMEAMAAATCALVLVLTPPMSEPRDVEAFRMEASVLEFTLAVPAVMAAAIEVDAVVRLAAVARAPAVRVASVRFRVPYVQTSAAVMDPPPTVETATLRLSTRCLPTVPAPESVEVATFQTSAATVPNEVRVRVPCDQTAVGMVAKSDDEAVKMDALVLVLIVVTAPAIEAASEVDAVAMVPAVEAVPAEMAEPREVDAVRMDALVLALTLVVPAEIATARDDEAFEILEATAAMSVQRMVSVFVLIPVTSAQAMVSVLVLMPVTSTHDMVSVLALI